MIKRKISSLLAGAALAAVISFSPTARAACNGLCGDTITIEGETYAFSSCRAYREGTQIRIQCNYAPLRPSVDG